MVHSGFFKSSRWFSGWLGTFLFLLFCHAAVALEALAAEPDKKPGNSVRQAMPDVGEEDKDVLRDLLDLRTNADLGDASAQFELGRRYFKGDGLEQNDHEAVRWIRSAAEGGLPRAQAGLGWFYAEGKGVKKDDTLSFSWYERAAVGGFPVAQFMLGRYYELGIGVTPDRTLAKEWYEKAAAQDYEKAKKRLQEWK